MIRFPSLLVAALFMAAAAIVSAIVPVPVGAQVPNRLYGSVTLNGAPAPVGTTIVALAGGKSCGTTTVAALQVGGSAASPIYPYILDVPAPGSDPVCKPGAILTFTVGGLTAAQAFTLDDLASFQRLDLTAPGTPNVPATTTTVALAQGCTEVTSTFADGTPTATLVAAISPAGALDAIWRYDAAARLYRGYSPTGTIASDLATINRGDTLRICASAAASLTAPA